MSGINFGGGALRPIRFNVWCTNTIYNIITFNGFYNIAVF